MIRIKQNRCGYSGYQCIGIDQLAEPFRYSRTVCDTEVNRTNFPSQSWEADTPEEVKYHMIDNYKNLPMLLKGFVMTLSPVLDMDVALPYPEKECRTNVDPFRTVAGVDGFLNFFDTYQDRVTGRMEGDAYVTLSDHMLCCNTDPGTTLEVNPEGEERTFEPGIIEPMLDTEFSPVGIELSTGLDASLDGILISIATITKWRTVVDSKLNDIYTRLGHITGIRNMLIAMQMESICEDFRITLTSGDPIKWTGSGNEPRYRIGGGTVYVNGNPHSVGSQTERGEFYKYLNVYTSGDDPMSVDVEMEDSPGGDFSLGLGGVRLVYKKQNGVPTYRVYQIVQERCTFEIELVRTSDEGFLFRTLDGDVPYKAYGYGECPKEDDENP